MCLVLLSPKIKSEGLESDGGGFVRDRGEFCVSVSIIRRNFLFLSFVVLLPCTPGSFPNFFTVFVTYGIVP